MQMRGFVEGMGGCVLVATVERVGQHPRAVNYSYNFDFRCKTAIDDPVLMDDQLAIAIVLVLEYAMAAQGKFS